MALLTGINHVATLTADLDRLIGFYTEVFDAEVTLDMTEGGLRHAMIDLGGGACLHPFQIEGNSHGTGSGAIFDRGHMDHLALNVADEATFELLRARLVEAGASDGTVTDFGNVKSVWFLDPDGFGSEIALWRDGEPRPFDQRGQEPFEAAAPR
jgi:catechol 2,3-dioxygenase-like lactoylglutathione lyase family enzyme